MGSVPPGSTVGDSGTEVQVAPSLNPDVSSGVIDMTDPGAATYIPRGSDLLHPGAQARIGIDALGGFEAIPGRSKEDSFAPDGPAELTAPSPGPFPSGGAGMPAGGSMGVGHP